MNLGILTLGRPRMVWLDLPSVRSAADTSKTTVPVPDAVKLGGAEGHADAWIIWAPAPAEVH